MKKTRVFKPVRAAQKPSTRWPSRPSVEREKCRRFAEAAVADLNAFHKRLHPESAEPNALNAVGKPINLPEDAKPEGFAVTKDLDVIRLSASMAGRRLLAVVLFGNEDVELVQRIIRARLVAKQGDPALRDCLQDAVRKCRESRRSQDAQL
ncbi:hypothetical protein L810_1170 [Burkholderia sp. AU4i]|uniref:hypothetical protein n=1 Tax=Burkholderia sp. AU4i TaxID=1335308 RepID=UPI000398DB3E|nr:hypothetical protein [Burkholderia sp. AU4i]ERJ35913.1 hypothetical protein L810_1170 [Burkholderia sp. AU4i]